MAGQEIKGNLWYQPLGRDPLPLSSCVGFRSLSHTSMQNFGSSDPRLTKIALNKALRSCV